MTGRLRASAPPVVAVVLLASCSSPAPLATASSVEQGAASLVATGPPTAQWVPVDTEVLSAAMPPDGQRTTTVDGVPVLLRADPSGVVTDAATGWMRRVPAAQATAICRETVHWVAVAEEKHAVVPTAGESLSDACGQVDVSSGEGTPVAGECGSATTGSDSTCLYIGVDPIDGGDVRVTAILLREHLPA